MGKWLSSNALASANTTAASCVEPAGYAPMVWITNGPALATISAGSGSGTSGTSATIQYSTEDGVTMGWLVAACFVAAFGIKFLARALRGETGGDYGSR